MLSAFLFYFAFRALSERLEKRDVFSDETANFDARKIVLIPAATFLASLLLIALVSAF